MIAGWLILWLEDSQITGETHFCVCRHGCFCGRLAFEWAYSSLAPVMWPSIMQSVECPAGTNGFCLSCSEWTLLPSWSWGLLLQLCSALASRLGLETHQQFSLGFWLADYRLGALLSFWSCLGQSMISFCVISLCDYRNQAVYILCVYI